MRISWIRDGTPHATLYQGFAYSVMVTGCRRLSKLLDVEKFNAKMSNILIEVGYDESGGVPILLW